MVQVFIVMNVLLHAGLWLGGLGSLLHGNEYAHILSVIAESPYEPPESTKSHLTIPVFDVESAVLIRHFPAGIAFIKKGLEEGGKVLVHCAAGVSRSATVSLSIPQHALPSSTWLCWHRHDEHQIDDRVKPSMLSYRLCISLPR